METISPFSKKASETLINEYIQALYARHPDMDGHQFGDKVHQFLMEMDAAIGRKDNDALNQCVQEAFEELA